MIAVIQAALHDAAEPSPPRKPSRHLASSIQLGLPACPSSSATQLKSPAGITVHMDRFVKTCGLMSLDAEWRAGGRNRKFLMNRWSPCLIDATQGLIRSGSVDRPFPCSFAIHPRGGAERRRPAAFAKLFGDPNPRDEATLPEPMPTEALLPKPTCTEATDCRSHWLLKRLLAKANRRRGKRLPEPLFRSLLLLQLLVTQARIRLWERSRLADPGPSWGIVPNRANARLNQEAPVLRACCSGRDDPVHLSQPAPALRSPCSLRGDT